MEKKSKAKTILMDLLISFIIAVIVLGIVILATWFVQSQYQSLFIMDKGIIITSDIIGFIVIFLIAFLFMRSGHKNKNKE